MPLVRIEMTDADVKHGTQGSGMTCPGALAIKRLVYNDVDVMVGVPPEPSKDFGVWIRFDVWEFPENTNGYAQLAQRYRRIPPPLLDFISKYDGSSRYWKLTPCLSFELDIPADAYIGGGE